MRESGYTLTDMYKFWESPRVRISNSRHDALEKNRGGVTYYLYGNEIAHLDPKSHDLTLRDAGEQTHTTKDRLNKVLHYYSASPGGAGYFPYKIIGSINQRDFQWYFALYYGDGNWGKDRPWLGSLRLNVAQFIRQANAKRRATAKRPAKAKSKRATAPGRKKNPVNARKR